MALIASWAFFALLALAWTGGALLAVELARWAAQALASGDLLEASRALATASVPDWLAIWVAPDLARVLQSAVLAGMEHARDALPFLGTTAGWLVPLLWGAWALGLLLLLALAVGVHLFLRRLRRRRRGWA